MSIPIMASRDKSVCVISCPHSSACSGSVPTAQPDLSHQTCLSIHFHFPIYTIMFHSYYCYSLMCHKCPLCLISCCTVKDSVHTTAHMIHLIIAWMGEYTTGHHAHFQHILFLFLPNTLLWQWSSTTDSNKLKTSFSKDKRRGSWPVTHPTWRLLVCFLWSILPKSERLILDFLIHRFGSFFSIALRQPVYSMNVSISYIIFQCFRLWTLNMSHIPLRCCCVDV